MLSFQDKIQALFDRIEVNNGWRQKETFNLIPSESTPSLLVKMCEISDPSGRYAEHRTMKGEEIYFYQGIDFSYFFNYPVYLVYLFSFCTSLCRI